MHGVRQRASIVVIAMLAGFTPSHATPLAKGVRRTTTDRTVALVQRWVAGNATDLEAVVADNAILVDADPSVGAMLFGRRAILDDIAQRKTTHCVLELAIVSAGDAAILRHCTSSVPAKTPPTERVTSLHRISELRLDRAGAIARVTGWFDGLRALQQIGVGIGVDARPDVPASQVTIARAHSDPIEAANDAAARAVFAALDRRDFADVARRVADNSTHHDLAFAEPAVFATAAQYERSLRDELASCEESAFRVLSTIAAEAWVAVRYGHSCRPPDASKAAPSTGRRGSYTTGVWLMRFADGHLVESWRASNRFDETLQLGRLDQRKLREQIQAAGL